MQFEDSSLWRSAFSRELPDHKDQRDRLRSELGKFRQKASALTSRISGAFPQLTQHDVTHLDALWEIGSMIAGPNYPITPLEGFVFGAAVLLHDAALCFEAYEGGRDAVRAHVTWKDALALERLKSPKSPQDELEAHADFVAVRYLHASQAKVLVEHGWKDPATGELVYLLDDSHLRKHLGELIGKIAASHHWSIEDVEKNLVGQFNAPGEFPTSWRIEPRKLACLLRCADALHFDHLRAPDFFHAMLRRNGIPFQHWQAQNQIGRIDLDTGDTSGQTVLLTTTKPFREAHSASWWIIHDAACIAQRELDSSNALLTANHSVAFQVKRIKGLESPEQMAHHVQAEGWAPCAASLHISNVEQLVRALGGIQLYGSGADPLAIALREVIQNSRDAIKAREAIEKGFRGKIRVKVSENNPATIEIEDNGCGMSKRVLTGPLLDFGTSFWASSLVQAEFPGLVSSPFKPVGKFGIGFYSIFMVSDHVTVTTRRWDEGLKDAHQLIFKKGVALRPLLKSGANLSTDTQISTRIALVLQEGIISKDRNIVIKPGMANTEDISVPLTEYIAVLVAGLDVDVEIEVKNDSTAYHSAQLIERGGYIKWLNRIAFANYRNPAEAQTIIASVADRLRPIMEGERCLGLASIATMPSQQMLYTSLATVGGLATTVQGSRSTFYVGFLDYLPKSAQRDQGELAASPHAINAWATEQEKLLRTAPLHKFQRAVAAYGLAQFGVDPTDVATFPIRSGSGYEFFSASEVVQLVRKTPVVFFKSNIIDHIEMYQKETQFEGCYLFHAFSNGDFNSLKFKDGVPETRNSAVGCLHAEIIKMGLIPNWEFRKNVVQGPFGWLHAVILRAEESPPSGLIKG